jgi:hypothetical protein
MAGYKADRCWSDEPFPFEVELYRARREDQTCDECRTEVHASIDELRVQGWVAFDGPSVTAKDLHVRLCPACRRKGTS